MRRVSSSPTYGHVPICLLTPRRIRIICGSIVTIALLVMFTTLYVYATQQKAPTSHEHVHRHVHLLQPVPPGPFNITAFENDKTRHQLLCRRTTPTAEYSTLIVGMVKHLDELHDSLIEQISELNCKHGFMLELLSGSFENADRFCSITHPGCAPIRITTQPSIMADPAGPYANNRVARITFGRTTQRADIRARYGTNLKVVVSVDMDLLRMAPVAEIVRNAESMVADSSHADIVAALGLDFNQVGDEYYDTYATVLDDGTFVYPRVMRMLDVDPPGQDYRLDVSMTPFGDFTQWDLTRYLQYRGRLDGGMALARSAFGGMALYRAHVFLYEECSHEAPYSFREALREKREDNIYVYGDRGMGRPCEHVVFHFCLRKKLGARLGVDPELRTYWRGNPSTRHRHMLLNDHSWWVPVYENTLATFKPHFKHEGLLPEAVLTLTRGTFEARVSVEGKLLVENKATGKVVWTPPADEYIAEVSDNWYRLLAVVGPYGELMIIQQLEAAGDRTECRVFDDAPAPRCRELLWRTDGIGPGSYLLDLTEEGHLQMHRWNTTTKQYVTYWSSSWDPEDENGPYTKIYGVMTECYRSDCPDLHKMT